ncbi:adult cuticle protein 1-like isoform X2 [Musca domestica]|uniref:Adult cuticle protein 1-like isoform X2 n=1 Tax=Musca domestica TaxID=7370 RepID=A0ABM3VNI6_MUSDO|nr:adult cuticle protein 1-like isoform X2 [Musca domestica]
MKFVCAVVLLALAVGVQSSLLLGGTHDASAWGHGAWGGPWAGHGAWGGPWAAHGAWAGPYAAHAAVDVSGAWGHGYGAWGGYPGISLSQGPGLAHGAHGPGVYVAKTRGAVHTAPLAGHLNSATSVNVAPAPGTH